LVIGNLDHSDSVLAYLTHRTALSLREPNTRRNRAGIKPFQSGNAKKMARRGHFSEGKTPLGSASIADRGVARIPDVAFRCAFDAIS
jgi:hypothetical protein